jgi:ABC-type polysaccharide/polyol phosphate transport system ATPase subunit
MSAVVELESVTKLYRRYAHRRQFATLKSAFLSGSLVTDLSPDETFTAIDDVTFQVPKGSACGIIGRNGSGKSTLLKLIAGITKPTRGGVRVRGRISALIELGAGFHPEISGRENVFINGVMLGLTKSEIAERFDEIVAFAELEEFIDAPVKNYSSGMYMRLGFAVAVHVDPDILIVDEVLAVGDEGFSLKCLDKFAEFKRRGKTILLVTHGLATVEKFCDQAVWLDEGALKSQGDPRRVVHAYLEDVASAEEKLLSEADRRKIGAIGSVEAAGDDADPALQRELTREEPPEDMFRASEGRWGSGDAVIDEVTIEGDGGPAHLYHTGDRMAVRLNVHAPEPLNDFVFGISIFNAEGVCCYGTNTDIEELVPDVLTGSGEVVFAIDSLDLVEGTYKLDVAVHSREGRPYDYHRLLHTFRVKSRTKDTGIYRPRHSWTFTPNIRFRERVVE